MIEQLISASIPMWNEVLLKTDEETSAPRIVTNRASFEPEWPAWARDLTWSTNKDDFTEEQIRLVSNFLDLPDRDGYMENPDEEEDADVAAEELEEPEDSDAEEDVDISAEEPKTKKGTMDWAMHYGLSSAMEWKYKRVRQLKHPEPGDYDSWRNGADDTGKNAPNIDAMGFILDSSLPNVFVEEGVESKGDVELEADVEPAGDVASIGSEDNIELEEDDNELEEDKLAEEETGHVKIQEHFRDLGLQVIVKLAGIELTPENAKYEGGSWHLEGMLNEHIVATSIYYYDVENVTDSHLRFRQNATLDDWNLDYEQDDHEPLAKIFGTESMRDEPAVQEIGRVATNEGRLLVFPNTLQHRVESFELKDVTKPGHRRFLLLWLVDPYYRVVSTANVPPQRHDWWADEGLRKVIDASKLPPELSKMVEDEVAEYPMSMEQAKKLRLELMEERTNFGEAVELIVEEYNLCEH